MSHSKGNISARTRSGEKRPLRNSSPPFAYQPQHQVEYQPIDKLRPARKNARRHSKAQILQLVESIRRFGFNTPVLVNDNREIVAGHGRVEAAKQLGLQKIPVLRLSHLSASELRAYALADNKIPLAASWDYEILAGELQEIADEGIEIETTGFSLAEFENVIEIARESSPTPRPDDDDKIDPLGELSQAVTQPGDIWTMGRHSLICGDARNREVFDKLLEGKRAGIIFTDPPYNVPIDGHVCGLGRVRHREFAMATGEMSSSQFTFFLQQTLGHAATCAGDGAIAYVCMDWRHIEELHEAGRAVFSELKNICVWVKTNGGMGSFYRSRHELVFVFKIGKSPHVNSFGLGGTGRYRTNVWEYAGVNSFGSNRDADLSTHPTVKPTRLVADALLDCSRRGDIVLDPFAGSGTTLIAAERVGRTAKLIEYDPAYCDRIIRRYETLTGKNATLRGNKQTFEDVQEARGSIR